jgi:trigger factor
MQVNVEVLSSVKKKINFEIPAERVNSEIGKVFDQVKKRAVVPGFRKGKVPQSLIEKHYQGQIEGDVIKNLFQDTYFSYIQENKIFPIDYPEIQTDSLTKGSSFKYSAIVEVFPEVKVDKYDKLEVTKEKFVPNAEVVEQRLQQMRESMAQLQPAAAEYAAATGDTVIIDFTGYLGAEPFENGAATDFQLELGGGSFIPGFEEQVVGMQAGEEKRIKVTFPESYHSKNLAGQPVDFVVAVKEIKVKVVPELNDDLAQEFGEFKTVAELREKIKELYEKQEQERIEHDCQEKLIKALIESNPLEVPGALVERQLNSMLENTKKRLSYQQMSLEMMGLDDQRYREQFRSVAESQVKGSLLLDALGNQENISVSEAEIDARIKQIAEEANQDLAKISDYYRNNSAAKENLSAQLREEKVLKLLASKALITEVERQETATTEA